MASPSSGKTVLVVGCGPVGLFTALLLARAGVKSELFERLPELRTGPRAAGHYGPDLEVMKKAGVYDLFAEHANLEDGLAFRALPVDDGKGGKTFGRQLAYIPDFQLILPQSKMVVLLEQELRKTGMAEIHFGKEAVAIDQDSDAVTLSTKDIKTGEVENFTGEYLVGSDGGKSTVRHLLGIRFPGHTWPERIIATDVMKFNDELAPIGPHLLVDRVHWGVVIPVVAPVLGQKSLWRYAITTQSTDTRPDEDLLQPGFIAAAYEKMMDGKRPLQYDVQQKAIYHMHQRLASTMRRGRCLLAGDAAHLNNPIGGMGLTTGILDAEALSDALIMVIQEGCSDRVLGLYSDLRRQVFGFFVDPSSTQNKARIASDPDELDRDDGFIRMLQNPTPASTAHRLKLYNDSWRTDIRSKFAAISASH